MTKEQYKEKLINRITELMDEDNTLLNVEHQPWPKNTNGTNYQAVANQRDLIQEQIERLTLILKTL